MLKILAKKMVLMTFTTHIDPYTFPEKKVDLGFTDSSQFKEVGKRLVEILEFNFRVQRIDMIFTQVGGSTGGTSKECLFIADHQKDKSRSLLNLSIIANSERKMVSCSDFKNDFQALDRRDVCFLMMRSLLDYPKNIVESLSKIFNVVLDLILQKEQTNNISLKSSSLLDASNESVPGEEAKFKRFVDSAVYNMNKQALVPCKMARYKPASNHTDRQSLEAIFVPYFRRYKSLSYTDQERVIVFLIQKRFPVHMFVAASCEISKRSSSKISCEQALKYLVQNYILGHKFYIKSI